MRTGGHQLPVAPCFMAMKIGIIGLGDIATKAYLPVMAKTDLEVHLYTRNTGKLKMVGDRYRFEHRHETFDSLLGSRINAAFVHTSTASHFPIVEALLNKGIHVYVDKPITYDLGTTEKLLSLAERNGLTLMAGFNRRYAPAYARLKELKDMNMVIMQKNRKSLPGDVRTFIFDDFIHVVDTLLFLFPHVSQKLSVSGRKRPASRAPLYHVVLQWEGPDGATAIGIMNRDSGTVEETVEVFTPEEKWVVTNVADTTVFTSGHATRHVVNDWMSTLHKRGFEQITDAFLERVLAGTSPRQLHQDIRRTHEMCENIVTMLE